MWNAGRASIGDTMVFARICKIPHGGLPCRPSRGNYLSAVFFFSVQGIKRNASFTSYSCRLMSPRFADGLTAPRISVTGRDLPLSRVVSRTMHPDDGFHDHAGTVMVIAWGQFMDHDYTLTGTPLGTLFIVFSIQHLRQVLLPQQLLILTSALRLLHLR